VRYRLAAVYAHPDDDTFSVGGIVAKHGGELDYTAIVATSGEAGLISDPALATQENLGSVREGEEREALRALGQENPTLHFLRYPDAGLVDVPRHELLDRVMSLLEEAQPHVVVTFGPEGVTRHDDHITIGQVTTEAFHEARSRAEPGSFQRLFYTAIAQSDLDAYWEAVRAEGLDPGNPDDPFMPRGVPDHTITARVDVGDVWETKKRALTAHRTQANDLSAIPAGVERRLFGAECFVQAWPPVTNPEEAVLSSLFEGLG
jgi:LmbE family N-acetylglucosaminyl deacetylase